MPYPSSVRHVGSDNETRCCVAPRHAHKASDDGPDPYASENGDTEARSRDTERGVLEDAFESVRRDIAEQGPFGSESGDAGAVEAGRGGGMAGSAMRAHHSLVGGIAPHSRLANGTTSDAFDAAGGLPTGEPRRAKKRRTNASRCGGAKRARTKMGGWVDMPRPDYRKLEGSRALADGNKRSCGQDALVNGAKSLGLKSVTKKQVYTHTLPAEGDTEVGVIIDYARDKLRIAMRDTQVPGTLGGSDNLSQRPGGPEHALLQIEAGVFFVRVVVSQEGKEDDVHFLLYNASYTCAEHPAVRGAIVDNEKDTPVKLIEPKDRAMNAVDGRLVPAARSVFASIWPSATRVRVAGAWLMERL